MKKNILLFTILAFLVSACDFEIKCLDCTTETITFKNPEEKNKVNEALDFMNEVFGEHFDKSNIEKIYDFPDKDKKSLLKLVAFKKDGYALISNIKNVNNPPVLMYSKGKFDPKNPNPGVVIYMEDFNKYAARDTINAILPNSKEFRDKMKKIIKNPKATKKNLKNLPKSYGYGGYGNYGSHNRPTHPGSRGIAETFPGDCYDRYGNRKWCSNYCIWENRRTYCGYRSCGGGICYDKRGRLRNGYYRKTWTVQGPTFDKHLRYKAPLLKTYWHQGSPYNNTLKRVKNEPYKLGCVTVAVGQIIAHHSPSYRNNLINVKKDEETDISLMLWDIASRVISSYGTNQSIGTHERAAYCFEDFGFKTSGWRWWSPFTFDWQYETVDYDYDTVKDEIYNGRPVYLEAWREAAEWYIFNGFFENWKVHAWVADGYREEGYSSIHANEYGYYSYGNIRNRKVDHIHDYHTTNKYIHMNWGWGVHSVDTDGNAIQTKGDNGWCTYDYWINVSGETKGDTRYGVDKGMITVRKRYHWER